MSKQYITCPYCGANLDPGERCDCQRATPGGPQIDEQSSLVQIVYQSVPSLPPIVFSHGKPRKEKAE